MKDFDTIQKLVGDASEEDLKYVDCFVAENLGIFVPSIGYCNFAITPKHIHPTYMFNLFVSEEHCIIEQKMDIPANHYLVSLLSPKIPHEEKKEDSFKRYYAILVSSECFNSVYNEKKS